MTSRQDYQEYDDYPIPKHDPSLTPEEREQIKKKCLKRLDEILEEQRKKQQSDGQRRL